MPPTRTSFDRAVSAAMQLVVYNFIAFWIISLCIGGDAVNGKIVGGQYFLDQNGRYTLVSHATWIYSRVHAISIIVTIPTTLIVAAIRSFTKARNRAT